MDLLDLIELPLRRTVLQLPNKGDVQRRADDLWGRSVHHAKAFLELSPAFNPPDLDFVYQALSSFKTKDEETISEFAWTLLYLHTRMGEKGLKEAIRAARFFRRSPECAVTLARIAADTRHLDEMYDVLAEIKHPETTNALIPHFDEMYERDPLVLQKVVYFDRRVHPGEGSGPIGAIIIGNPQYQDARVLSFLQEARFINGKGTYAVKEALEDICRVYSALGEEGLDVLRGLAKNRKLSVDSFGKAAGYLSRDGRDFIPVIRELEKWEQEASNDVLSRLDEDVIYWGTPGHYTTSWENIAEFLEANRNNSQAVRNNRGRFIMLANYLPCGRAVSVIQPNMSPYRDREDDDEIVRSIMKVKSKALQDKFLKEFLGNSRRSNFGTMGIIGFVDNFAKIADNEFREYVLGLEHGLMPRLACCLEETEGLEKKVLRKAVRFAVDIGRNSGRGSDERTAGVFRQLRKEILEKRVEGQDDSLNHEVLDQLTVSAGIWEDIDILIPAALTLYNTHGPAKFREAVKVLRDISLKSRTASRTLGAKIESVMPRLNYLKRVYSELRSRSRLEGFARAFTQYLNGSEFDQDSFDAALTYYRKIPVLSVAESYLGYSRAIAQKLGQATLSVIGVALSQIQNKTLANYLSNDKVIPYLEKLTHVKYKGKEGGEALVQLAYTETAKIVASGTRAWRVAGAFFEQIPKLFEQGGLKAVLKAAEDIPGNKEYFDKMPQHWKMRVPFHFNHGESRWRFRGFRSSYTDFYDFSYPDLK